MKALVASVGKGFTKLHEVVVPILGELGMSSMVVHSQSEARAAEGWDWALIDRDLPLAPWVPKGRIQARAVDAQTTVLQIPGVTGQPAGSLFADSMPLLKDLSASRPGARMLLLYVAKFGMSKEERAAYLAVPGVRGVFGYAFTATTLKAFKKALAEG